VRDLLGDADALYALKRLKNVERIARFEQEVKAVQSLNHPNVLTVVDASFKTDGKRTKPYLVSEYCAGGNLASGDPSRWAKDPVRTLEMFAEICDGVAAAHLRKEGAIVHRDIKPENVLLRTPAGPPVVGDFGIAYIEDGELERMTETEEAAGARFYIAPELEGGRADQVYPRSDVYSLGKLLYWMLSGGRIFAREQHREPKWNLLDRFRDNRYEHVNRLLDQMITDDSEDRLRDASRTASEVREVAKLFEIGARALGPGLEQPCDFCRQGTYLDVPVSNLSDHRTFFGVPPMPGAEWRVLVCGECGNVQTFRVDLARRREEWWPD
jgi:serine/threonine protein kinase